MLAWGATSNVKGASMFAVISLAVCFVQFAAFVYVVNANAYSTARNTAYTQYAVAQARKQHAAQAAYIRKYFK